MPDTPKKLIPDTPLTIFLFDPEKKPAFEKNSLGVLTKDYFKLYGPEECSKYLTKNAMCFINYCGIFCHAFDETTGDLTEKVSEEEWCDVTIEIPREDSEEYEEDEYNSYVKAVDLKEFDFDSL